MSFFNNSPNNNNNNNNRGHRRGGVNNGSGFNNNGFSNEYNSFAQRLGGSGGGNGNNNGGSSGGGHGNSDFSRIEVRNWQGGSRDNLVDFLFKKSRIRLNDVQVVGAVLRAKVTNNEASVLVNFNGIRFAGSALDIKSMDDNKNNGFNNRSSGGDRNGSQGMSEATKTTIQLLEEYLRSHYNPEIKFLNLENMPNDPFLISNGLLSSASTQSKMFPALMKIARDNIPKVDSISLANNGLSDLQIVTTLAATYPDLKNLSLANNNFINVSSLHQWRHKFPHLRELILSGNPISTTIGYKDDMIRMFPKLIVLDGQVIQDETQLNIVKIPLQVQHNFSENSDIGNIAGNFLSTFFDLYDKDRSQLLPLYDEQSTFTISLNITSLRQVGGPGNSSSRNTSTHPWNDYIPLSRNLTRVSSVNSKVSRLNVGPQAIASVFQKLPPTEHDLKSPEKFAVDVWSVKDIRAVGDQAIMIFVHGEFVQLNNRAVHSFDRSLVVLPGPNGNMIVSSDMLTIRPYSGNDGWKPLDSSGSNSAPGSASNTGSVPPSSGSPSTNPVSASSLINPDHIKHLSPPQQLVIKTLVEKTRLTANYAIMCAEQADYDLQQSLQLFEQSKSQLPPDAFFP